MIQTPLPPLCFDRCSVKIVTKTKILHAAVFIVKFGFLDSSILIFLDLLLYMGLDMGKCRLELVTSLSTISTVPEYFDNHVFKI